MGSLTSHIELISWPATTKCWTPLNALPLSNNLHAQRSIKREILRRTRMPLWWDLTSLKLFAASLSSGSIAPWRPRGSLYSGREEEMAGKSLPDFLPSRLTTWVSEDGSRVSIAGTLALHQCGLGSIPSSGPYVGWVCWFSYLLWAVSPRLLRFCPGYSGFPQATPVFPSRQTLTLHDLAWFVVPLTKKMPKPWDVNISCYYSVLKLKGGVEDIREKKKKNGRGRDWISF